MQKLRKIIAISLFGLFLSMCLSGAALSNPMSIGTIDVERAFDGYSKKDTLERQLQAKVTEVRQWFELRLTNRLLTDVEFDELWTLKTKANQSDADRSRADELLAAAVQRDRQFNALQQKQEYTDEESTQLDQFQDTIGRTQAAVDAKEQSEQELILQQRVDLSKQIMDEVEAAVATVAQEKGLTLVFNKSTTEAGLVVYSNVDITDEVLAILNKD